MLDAIGRLDWLSGTILSLAAYQLLQALVSCQALSVQLLYSTNLVVSVDQRLRMT